MCLLLCSSSRAAGASGGRCLTAASLRAAPRLPVSGPQTRGILTWVNDKSPGAFHPDIRYTTVAGRYIQVRVA